METYYIGQYYEKAVDGESTIVRKYYFAGSTRIAMREDGTLYWLLSDHLGSTSITTEADGTLYSEVRYSAFDEIRFAVNNTPTDYLYTGQRVEEAGLYYYVARFYDPYLAHFVQADSIVPGAGNALSYNRYAYVNYSPVTFKDPTGRYRTLEDSYYPGQTDGDGISSYITVYWRNQSEEELAEHQNYQGKTNDCSLYAISAALNLLYDSPGLIQGADLADTVDQNWVIPIYRTFPNGPTFPFQQTNILNALASYIPLQATESNLTNEELITNLGDPNRLQIITFYWYLSEGPYIVKGDLDPAEINRNFYHLPTGHTMVLTAHDPLHYDSVGHSRPWGFVNSWDYDPSGHIYWMSEQDMNRFSHAVVVVDMTK